MTGKPDDEPAVYAVDLGSGRPAFSRRGFMEIAAASVAVATVVSGCDEPVDEESPTPSQTPPGTPGSVEPGVEGTEYTVEGQTYSAPCGTPLPAGAVCTCDCVSVPAGGCSCVGHSTCSCVDDKGCSAVSHYWYPN